MMNNKIEKISICDTKGTLGRIESHVIISKGCEAFPQINYMVLDLTTLDKHIIQLSFHVVTKLTLKEFIN